MIGLFTAQLYRTDGSGSIISRRGYGNWRDSWYTIVPGDFGGKCRTEMLFYDRNAGYGEFYTTDDSGGITIFRGLSESDKRGIAAAYYTSVQFLDRNIGVVLNKLRALNLQDDTYVVYTADHGYMLGQHGRIEKNCGYDPALRVPLLMRFPGRTRKGIVDELTEHIDLPADSRYARRGAAAYHSWTEFTLLSRNRQNGSSSRTHITEYLENEEAYIRTKRYKFAYCTGKRVRLDGYKTDNPTPGRHIRLYDLEKEPGAFTDVAAQHSDLVERFEQLMLDRFRTTHPEGQQGAADNRPSRSIGLVFARARRIAYESG